MQQSNKRFHGNRKRVYLFRLSSRIKFWFFFFTIFYVYVFFFLVLSLLILLSSFLDDSSYFSLFNTSAETDSCSQITLAIRSLSPYYQPYQPPPLSDLFSSLPIYLLFARGAYISFKLRRFHLRVASIIYDRQLYVASRWWKTLENFTRWDEGIGSQ